MQQISGSYELKSPSHASLMFESLNQLLVSSICTSMQKISLLHLFIYEIQSIWESHDHTGHTHFLSFHPKKIWSAFNFCEYVLTCKKSVLSSVHSSDTVSFSVLPLDWPHSFLTMPIPIIFNHLLTCMNLYQDAKNQLILSAHSWVTVQCPVTRLITPIFDHAQPRKY